VYALTDVTIEDTNMLKYGEYGVWGWASSSFSVEEGWG
jgi:hypothetical protein